VYRTLLAAVLLVLAGCVGPFGGTTSPSGEPAEPATGAPPADSHATEDPPYSESYEFSAHTIVNSSFVDERVVEVSALRVRDGRNTAIATIENGTTSIERYRPEHRDASPVGPLANATYVHYNGTYYLLHRETVDTEPQDGHQAVIRGPVDDSERRCDERENATRFRELSAVDQAIFLRGYPSRVSDPEPFQYEYVVDRLEEDERDRSAIWTGSVEEICYQEGSYEVGVSQGTHLYTRQTIEYRSIPVGTTADGVVAEIRRRHGINLTGDRPSDEGSVLLDVVRNGTQSWSGQPGTAPAGFEATYERLSGPPSGPGRLVEWNGTLYHVTAMRVIA
jgi:hypothetical protein